jgi:hypothetical protein
LTRAIFSHDVLLWLFVSDQHKIEMAGSSLFRNQRQSEYPLQDIVTTAGPADVSVTRPRASTREATLHHHEEEADTVPTNTTVVLEASELKAHFEAQVREAFSSGSYENVAVLVISWVKEHDSHLDTSGDVSTRKLTTASRPLFTNQVLEIDCQPSTRGGRRVSFHIS